jgi:UDP:flavonoid glycosyltransferase YjiC (YdhE family)
MRVLMTTTAFVGHALPMVPFARALIATGHEVRIVGPRSRGRILTNLGLPYVGIYDSPEAAIRAVGMSTFDMPFEKASERIIGIDFGKLEPRAALSSVLATIDSWRPDIVIRESYDFAAAIAAELRAVPVCSIAVGLEVTERWTLAQALPYLGELRRELGLATEFPADAPCLTLTPDCLEPPALPSATRRRFRDATSAAAPPTDHDWAAPGDPLAYVSFGTIAGGLGLFPGFYRAAALSLAQLPVRVLITVGENHSPSDLGQLPPNVLAERWVPQDFVMQRAALTVGHAGYGSMITSLRHGVPMVVMPLFQTDQYNNASSVVANGAGLLLQPLPNLRALLTHGADALTTNLAAAAARVLAEPSFKIASTHIAEQFASLPAVDDVATTLVELFFSAKEAPAPARRAAGGASIEAVRPPS